MKIKFGIFLLLLILINGVISAGELSDELHLKISNKADVEIVSVWIKVADSENPLQLKSDLQQIEDRAERYQIALNRIKNKHNNAQRNLLTDIKATKNKSTQSLKLKGHWLVNIIEAELSVGEIKTLVQRDDIIKIYSEPVISSIEPIEPTTIKTAPSKSAGIESSLSYVNAPDVWNLLGYTGKGRVVCTFDTGVDGMHPALFNNWKGHDGDSAAAWFDPVKQEAFPHYIPDCGLSPCRSTHGTHVMGTICGHDDATGDTIGVAPDAKWISAAVIDIAGVSIIDGFEWAANPDGNPNTLGDVPDVINHSWGVPGIQCEELFYDMIDYTEALGIVNIISAGNEGGTSTIRNPADRALTNIDCFAIGNINHLGDSVVTSSSRGPSTCQPGAFKPNVSAPGYNIRSCLPNNIYGALSGTSMAAPHVSGLVALMREKNPNATVDEIKTAILNSAVNMGQSVPNNDLGWGRIDCLAAVNALSDVNAAPNLKIYSFDHPPISAGDTVLGSLVLKNLGASVSTVSIGLVDNNDALTVVSGSAGFGTIGEGDTVRAVDNLEIIVSDTVTPGTILSLDMNISGSSYNTTTKLFFLVEPKLERSFVTHNSGNIDFSVSNFGTLGLGDFSFVPLGGAGFDYLGGGNDLFEGGLMIGSGFSKVSDGIRNIAGEPDGDFKVLPNLPFALTVSPDNTRQESSSFFSDERSEDPIGLEITQNSYSFFNTPYKDAIVLEYIVKNTTGSTLPAVDVGLYTDWDVPSYDRNAGGYSAAENISWVAYNSGTIISDYRGIKIIKGSTNTSYTNTASLVSFDTDGFTEFEKINALADGLTSADDYTDGQNDLIQIVASRLVLAPGAIDTVAFAISAGVNLALLSSAADQAAIAYLGVITDVPGGAENLLPENFVLHQNYPNPFNPATSISFDLPRATNYILSIYNIQGQKVDSFEKYAQAGTVLIEWDASNYASGIYLYKLETDEFSESKKMLLLK